MTKLIRALWAAGFVLLLQQPVSAQTCSCAAVPILGAMGSASPRQDQWILAGTYEFHDIGELVQGSSTVPDETDRDRTSEALIVEASRGFGTKWSLSALLSLVNHERDVGDDRVSASGLGDALLMVKYSPKKISLYEKTTVSFGLGARIPVGQDDAAEGGIVLAEDLQPSTGAYATIGWFHAARALTESANAQVYFNAAYTHNGDNDRDYQFGHAARASVGGSYQFQSPWGVNLELVYRDADRDRRGGVEIPNTGGSWLDVVPAVQYHLNESIAIKAAVKIPVARDLNDQLQFSTKYAFRLSVAGVFGQDRP